MTKTRVTHILVLALFGVASALPVVAACACLMPAPEPELVASCHIPPAAGIVAGCCCLESPPDEVVAETGVIPSPRDATMSTVAAGTAPVAMKLAVAGSTMLSIRGAPSGQVVPLRL